MREFLRDNGIFVTDNDAYLLIRQYDSNNDGRLSFTEFKNLSLPATSSSLSALALSRPGYVVSYYERLPYSTEAALARLFEAEIEFHRHVEAAKKDLGVRYDFRVLDAFRAVDRLATRRFSREDVRDFCRRNGDLLYELDLDAVIRRLDTDSDERISYLEFCEAVLPAGAASYEPAATSSSLNRSFSASRPERLAYSASPAKRSRRDLSMSASRRFDLPPRRHYPYYPKTYDYYVPRRSVARDYASPARTSPSKTLTPQKLRSSLRDELEEEKYTTPTKTGGSPYRARASGISPMKGYEEDEFADNLKEQISLERDLESAKQSLALRGDFNLDDLFMIFDLDNIGFLRTFELKEGLALHGVYASHEEAQLLLNRYDNNRDGRLSFTEFADAFAPKDLSYAAMLRARYPHGERLPRSQVFSLGTKDDLAHVLRLHLRVENAAERTRQRQAKRPLFSIAEAFDAVDKNHNGFITKNEFAELLDEHRFFASNKELDLLIDRYDKNKDGRVSYSEFVREVAPQSPQK